MNRDEVVRLSDKELQIEVALLHHFESVTTDVNGLRGYIPEDDEGRGKGYQLVPDYPNDIAAACILQGEVDRVIFTTALLELWGDWKNIWKDGEHVQVIADLVYANARDRTRAFILAMTQEGK